MKTWFALAFFYFVIGLLAACAIVIVAKLIFWPPCTQTGNTCVVEPWSVAGLAGTVLAVSATVLAILGAVAVAAWWTSLNRLVTERVQTLYESQKKEVNTQVDHLLKEQQQKVGDQMALFQDKLAEARVSIGQTLKLAEESSRLNKESKTSVDEMTEKLKSLEAGLDPLKESTKEQLRNLELLVSEMRGFLQSNNLQAPGAAVSSPDTNNPTGT